MASSMRPERMHDGKLDEVVDAGVDEGLSIDQ
jgi:hypothetical protein